MKPKKPQKKKLKQKLKNDKYHYTPTGNKKKDMKNWRAFCGPWANPSYWWENK